MDRRWYSMNLLMKRNNNSNILGTAIKFEHTDLEKSFVILMKNGVIKTGLGLSWK